MLKNKGLKVGLVIFVAILFAALLPIIWHSVPITNQIAAFSLIEYDTQVSDGNVCFGTRLDTQKIEYLKSDFVIKVNGKMVDSFELEVDENFYGFGSCIGNEFFIERDNFVELQFYFKKLFFHVEKVDDLNKSEPIITIFGIEKLNDYEALLSFTFSGDESKEIPIYVQSSWISSRKIYVNAGKHEEIVKIGPGYNRIELSYFDEYGSVKESIGIENQTALNSNILIGVIIISLLMFSLFAFVFTNKDLYERIALTLGLFFIILMAVFLLLNAIGQVSSISYSAVTLFIVAAIIYWFRENYSLPKIKFRKPNHFEIFLILILLTTLLFNVITPTNVSFWTSFYERQSETIFENSGIPMFDEFTHFGEKPFGYISGYFFVNSGIAFLFGQSGEAVFSVIMLLANAFLIVSSIAFFRKIGMNKEQSLLTTMLILLGGFILGDIFFNIRHVISLSLAFLSMYLFVSDRRIPAGIIGGMAMFVQTPIVLFIAIVVLALSREKIVDMVKYFIYVGIVGFAMFLPVFFLHGPLTQAKASTWGYFFGMPFYGVIIDLLAQLLFFFLIMLPLVKFRPKFDLVSKKAFAFLIALLLIQLFVSYRVNVATIIIFSFLCIYWFPKDLLKKKEVQHLLFVIFVFGLYISTNVLLNYVVPDYAIHPVEFIEFNTSTESRFLVEPALGHYTAYFAQRKISTDLAVEYADQELIDDSFNFLLEKDPEIVKKHDIDYVFNRSKYIETQPVGSKNQDKPIEFDFLDKIYDNGTFFIHRVR